MLQCNTICKMKHLFFSILPRINDQFWILPYERSINLIRCKKMVLCLRQCCLSANLRFCFDCHTREIVYSYQRYEPIIK